MPETVAIVADNLRKTYYLGVRRRPVVALRDVSFEVKRGEVFAFLGLNGAGKTTTIKMLLDHARPSAGRCFLFGIDAKFPKSRERVGYMPDLPNFYRFLTAAELLDYFGRLHGLSRHDRNSRSEKLINLVGLKGRESEPLKGFSRGMLQRVGLAQALIGDPELLILDEPLGGLDPVGRYEFHNIIQTLKTDGRTIFFSSHILEDAQKIADRVGIIHQGTLVVSGTMSELVKQQSGYEIELYSSQNTPTIEKMAEEKGWNLTRSESVISITIPNETEIQEVVSLASINNVMIHSIIPLQKSLEDVFISELEKWKH